MWTKAPAGSVIETATPREERKPSEKTVQSEQREERTGTMA